MNKRKYTDLVLRRNVDSNKRYRTSYNEVPYLIEKVNLKNEYKKTYKKEIYEESKENKDVVMSHEELTEDERYEIYY